MIGLGFVMLIVVMFGDHGACSERKCSLQVVSFAVTSDTDIFPVVQ